MYLCICIGLQATSHIMSQFLKSKEYQRINWKNSIQKLMAWIVERTNSLLDRSVQIDCCSNSMNVCTSSYSVTWGNTFFLYVFFLSLGSTSNHLNAIKKNWRKNKYAAHSIWHQLWIILGNIDNFNRYILFIYKVILTSKLRTTFCL